MDISKYLDEKRSIQESFLEFLENDEKIEENFDNFKIILDNLKILDNKHEFRLILHLISSICDNHFRGPTFFDKIERTIKYFKDHINNYYSNSEIFSFFKQNKRILLFLIKEGIIIVDEYVARKITTGKFAIKFNYPQYFLPEIKPFSNEKWFPKKELSEDLQKELPENFNELREKGENESFICNLIREDSVEDFIAYFNKNCISPNAIINKSIYETNQFLLERHYSHLFYQINCEDVSLIEYAAFFGSIQIFTYLKNVNADLTPLLFFYGIHSKNAELIHLIEELHIYEKSYRELFYESIKCHHNDIANYFINYLKDEDVNSYDTFIESMACYNFTFLPNKQTDGSNFRQLCHFDYYEVVKYLSTIRDPFAISMSLNQIQNHIIQSHSKSYNSITFKIILFNYIQNHNIQ